MLKRFPVLISIVFLLSMLSFVVAAEYTEPESFSFEESSTLAMEQSSTLAVETSSETLTETTTEDFSEPSTASCASDDHATIINRLDLIYTLGLFVVGVLAALLVVFIFWRVLDVFI